MQNSVYIRQRVGSRMGRPIEITKARRACSRAGKATCWPAAGDLQSERDTVEPGTESRRSEDALCFTRHV